jgi:hypothetical protein
LCLPRQVGGYVRVTLVKVRFSKTREVDRKVETPAAEIQAVNSVIMREQARRDHSRGVCVRLRFE